jgi:hypothetical protein
VIQHRQGRVNIIRKGRATDRSHKIHLIIDITMKLAIRGLPSLEVELVVVTGGCQVFSVEMHITLEMELGSVADNL